MIDNNKRFSVKTILVATVSVLLLIVMSIGLVLALPSQSVNQKAEAATDFTTPTSSEQTQINNEILADWGNPTSGNFIELKSNAQIDFTGDKWYYLTSDIYLNERKINLKENCNLRILLNGYRITGTLVMNISTNARVSIFDKIPNKRGTGYNYNQNSNGSMLTGNFSFDSIKNSELNLYGIKILNCQPVSGQKFILSCGWYGSMGGGTINAYQMTMQNCAGLAIIAKNHGILNFKYCKIYDNTNHDSNIPYTARMNTASGFQNACDIWIEDSTVICNLYKSNVGAIIGTSRIYTKDVNFGNQIVTVYLKTISSFFETLNDISGTIELGMDCTTNYRGNSPNLNFIVHGRDNRFSGPNSGYNNLTLSSSARVNTVVVSGTGQIESGATVGQVYHDGKNGRLIDNRYNPAMTQGNSTGSSSKVTVNSGTNLSVLDIRAGDYLGVGVLGSSTTPTPPTPTPPPTPPTPAPTTDISASNITVTVPSGGFVYNGKAHTPAVTVTYNGRTLTQGRDYTLSYTNNIYPGTAIVTVTGIDSYSGSKTATFNISAANLNSGNVVVSVAGGNYIYNGQPHTPAVTVTHNGVALKQGTDYAVSYSNNIYPGTATATITGTGNCTGTQTATFTINNANMGSSNITVSLSSTSFVYTGQEHRPSVTVRSSGTALIQGTDYTVAYANNIYPGTATVTVTGKGYCSGTRTVTFSITNVSMSSSNIVVNVAGGPFVYNGQPHTPAVTVTNNGVALTKDTDYTVAYRNNINPGTATVTVTGMGYYTGSKTATFTITGISLNSGNVTVTVASGNYIYNGQPHTPDVIVTNNGATLIKGVDYTVTYTNNVNASLSARARVTVTGIGSYTGSRTEEFAIGRANRPAFNMSELEVSQLGAQLKDFNDRLPNGWSWQNPELVIDANVTTVVAEYTAADKANYINTTETVLVRYNGILPNSPEKNIALATIMLENNQTSFTYTGKEFRPAVTVTARDGVTLVEGRDYTVSYMHNQNAGIANILVEAITTTKATNNSYYGKQMVNFEIKRAAVKEAPIQSITITNAGTILGQCQLPIGWTWENPNLEITANTGVVYAVYTGADSGNYFNTRARISVVYNVAGVGVVTGGNTNGAMIVWIVVGVLLFVILIIILLLVLGKRRNKDEEAEEFTKLVALGNNLYQARMQQQAIMQQQAMIQQQQMLNMARPRQVVRRVVRRPIEDRSFMLGDGGVNQASNRDSQQFYLPSGRDNGR